MCHTNTVCFKKYGCEVEKRVHKISKLHVGINLQTSSNYVCKSLSGALSFASTNPQYDDRLFIELRAQYMKIASSEHVVYKNCSECQNVLPRFELGIFMY